VELNSFEGKLNSKSLETYCTDTVFK